MKLHKTFCVAILSLPNQSRKRNTMRSVGWFKSEGCAIGGLSSVSQKLKCNLKKLTFPESERTMQKHPLIRSAHILIEGV